MGFNSGFKGLISTGADIETCLYFRNIKEMFFEKEHGEGQCT